VFQCLVRRKNKGNRLSLFLPTVVTVKCCLKLQQITITLIYEFKKSTIFCRNQHAAGLFPVKKQLNHLQYRPGFAG